MTWYSRHAAAGGVHSPGMKWNGTDSRPVDSWSEGDQSWLRSKSRRRKELQLRSAMGDGHRRRCRRTETDAMERLGITLRVKQCGFLAGEIIDKWPSDTGDVSNKGYRSSVVISKSYRTRFGESWQIERLNDTATSVANSSAGDWAGAGADQGPTRQTETAAETHSGSDPASPETPGQQQAPKGHRNPGTQDGADPGSKREHQPRLRQSTVAVVRAAFRAWSSVRWAGLRGVVSVGVDSTLDSRPRLAAERASAGTWWVKPKIFVMNEPQSDWCGILSANKRYRWTNRAWCWLINITSVAIPDTLAPKAAAQAEHVTVQCGKHLPNVLVFTEEPAWGRIRRWSTQSWAVPFHTEHHGIGHCHNWPKSKWKFMTWRDRLVLMCVPQCGKSPGRPLPNLRLQSRNWDSMSTWHFVIPDSRDGDQCCLNTARSPADASLTFVADKSSMRRSWTSGINTRTMFGEAPGSTRTSTASSLKA